ncbi:MULTISPECIES: hypothetical protein [Corallincola]|uniref:Uncharacterized protein n=3 Tax=Corallincola TaxID=1775176 RepID=A0A368NPR8_9GAMM|nr:MULTISPECIES: hypothetical protein [Corallincola]RCU51449.1 hypothetical protein DU002_02950 [Corallincola holothuriorum]TAA46950.1 hypothetical protein EXY25_06760 [Corallincola spongiicola]TCI04600.1 hypothetical protein EZV61_01065 [Corallincola luteus]
MDVSKAKLGNFCATKKGDGRIRSIDKEHHLLLMADYVDDHEFVVRFDEVINDPQVHNSDDIYY